MSLSICLGLGLVDGLGLVNIKWVRVSTWLGKSFNLFIKALI